MFALVHRVGGDLLEDFRPPGRLLEFWEQGKKRWRTPSDASEVRVGCGGGGGASGFNSALWDHKRRSQEGVYLSTGEDLT